MEAQTQERATRRPTPPPDSGRNQAAPPRELVAGWLKMLMLAIPALTIAFAGSKEPWALGGFACLVGLAFVVAPVNNRISVFIWAPLAVMLLVMLTSFLPEPDSWFPEWRVSLMGPLGIPLSHQHTPQPWGTFESWQLVAVGLLWLLYCLGRRYGSSDRRWLVQGLALIIAAFAVVAMIFKAKGIHVPWWESYTRMEYYGPFPNRNHFSSLLAVGAVLAFSAAYDAYRRHRWTWVLFGILMLPMFAAVLLNTSRAGVILLFLGLGAWMFMASFHRRSAQRVAIFATVLLLLSSAFLLYGERIMGRFVSRVASTSQEADERLLLAGDALHLLSQNPLRGIGLGNFEAIFAMSKSTVNLMVRNLHPESDWLWFADETGMVCLVLALFAAYSIINRAGPFRTGESSGRRERRLRNGAAIGALIVAVHGIVDTPAHTLGIWTVVALLCGVALKPSKRPTAPPKYGRWWSLGAGLICIACGVNWLTTAYALRGLPSASMAQQLERKAEVLATSRDYAGAVLSLNQALEMRPLSYSEYFQRAMWLLDLGRSPQEALMDFSRARALELQNGDFCFREVQVWLDHRLPMYAFPALRDAMARDPANATWYYASMLGQVASNPEAKESMRLLATTPQLKLAFLVRSTAGEDFEKALQSLLSEDPKLESLGHKERLDLFREWYAKGNRAQLIALLRDEKLREWRHDGWPVLADDLAANGKMKEAYQLAVEQVPQPAMTPIVPTEDVEQLRRSFLINPTDLSRGLALFEALKNAGRDLEAIATLEKLAKMPDCPARVWYEEAILYARQGDYGRAWDQMKNYVQRVSASDSGNV